MERFLQICHKNDPHHPLIVSNGGKSSMVGFYTSGMGFWSGMGKGVMP